MSPFRSRYVTACQQFLVLGTVLVALTPAASVVRLDLAQPSQPVPGAGAGVAPSPAETRDRAAAREDAQAPLESGPREATAAPAPDAAPARVPERNVAPQVTEVALTSAGGEARNSEPKETAPEPDASGEGMTPDSLGPRPAEPETTAGPEPSEEATGDVLVSEPQPVTGYGTVGITWRSGVDVPADAMTFEVRSLKDGRWSVWQPIEYQDEHGPAKQELGDDVRPGTDPVVVGDVDEVQVRVSADGARIPDDMSLAVVDPGTDGATATEPPAIDTGADDPATTPQAGGTGEAPGSDVAADGDESAAGTDSDGALALRATEFTPKPQIFSRAQWGADESLRDGSPSYYEIQGGFVHHTVNSNDYTRDQVPSIIRGIYAYHTRSRGWSDIGYNFLVDRFGRIWEGRAGGVDRPVVGAHTLGYNDYAFAMSAIGNFDTARPSEEMLRAYGRLMGWKLSLHGVDAASTSQRIGDRTFPAINGHRDAGSTACPGRYLYAQLPAIRRYAKAAQRSWAGRQLESNLASTGFPDIVVRRKSDGRAFVLPTGGLLSLGTAQKALTGLDLREVVATPDVTGDKTGDVLLRMGDGSVQVRSGDGKGGFGAPVRTLGVFKGYEKITAVGDLNGDGRNDLVGRQAGGNRLVVFLGDGDGTFRTVLKGTGWGGYDLISGVGDVTGDGRPDVVVREGGVLTLRPGIAGSTFGADNARRIPGSYGGYDTVAGGGDWNGDRTADLVLRSKASGATTVLPGRGDGTFGRALGPMSRAAGLSSLSTAQVTGSPELDLVGRSGSSVVVVPNRGRFDTRAPIDTGLTLGWADTVLRVGDWDRDGKGDLVARSADTGTLYLFRGLGGGKFADRRVLAKGFGSVRLLTAAGDFDGDGWPDLLGQPTGGAMRLYSGGGLSGIESSVVARSARTASSQIGIGRWDSDGAPDTLLRKGDRLVWMRGNGPGGLTGGETDLGIDLSRYDWVLGVSDMTGSAHPDVIVRERATGYLWMLPGTQGGFGPRRFLAEGMGAYSSAG